MTPRPLGPTGAELAAALELADERPGDDLVPGAVLIARVEYPALDEGRTLAMLDDVAAKALAHVEADAGVDGPLAVRIDAINRCLYGELGFRGNQSHYSDVRNSCLNQVLERRSGIPITLAIVYIEVARRAGLRAEGVNFPGHFLVRAGDSTRSGHSESLLVDAFNGGAILADDDCRALLARHDASAVFRPEMLGRASRRQIFTRMLRNLKRLYVQQRSFGHAYAVTDALVALMPSALDELRDRGLIAYHLHQYAPALGDLEEYLRLFALTDRGDDARDETSQVWDHVKALRRKVASLN